MHISSSKTTITSTNSFNDPVTLIIGSGGVAWVPFSPFAGAPQVLELSIPRKIDGQPVTGFGGPEPSTNGPVPSAG